MQCLEQKAARGPPFSRRLDGAANAGVALTMTGRKAVAAAPICEQQIGQMSR
jgi:hypothetical protein